MDNTIKTSCSGRVNDEGKNARTVSDDEMGLFSQLLDESSSKIGKEAKSSSKETIYSDKSEKEAEKLKDAQKDLEGKKTKLSASKDFLYNYANRDKSTLSLSQKAMMGLNADGMAKAAVMHGSFSGVNPAQGAEIKADAALLGAQAAEKSLDMKDKAAVKAPSANANALANQSDVAAKPEISSKAAERAERAEAQRNIKREEVIKQIINHVEMKNFGSKTELTIKLNPEFMGNMKMRLLFEGDKVSAEFNTTSKEVRQALEESVDELSQALADNGVRVNKVNVHLVDEVS